MNRHMATSSNDSCGLLPTASAHLTNKAGKDLSSKTLRDVCLTEYCAS